MGRIFSLSGQATKNFFSAQSRQTRPVKRPPSLEAPLQASLSLSCATLARPCRCALPPNRRAPPPNTPTRRAARHPDGRPDPHFRLRAHASASRAAERIAAGIVGSSSETRGSAGTFRHGTYHGTSERESGASFTRAQPASVLKLYRYGSFWLIKPKACTNQKVVRDTSCLTEIKASRSAFLVAKSAKSAKYRVFCGYT